jgi:hypothetical protein
MTGKLTLTVKGKDGEVKRFPQTPLERLLNRPGKPMIVETHNAVTDEGDAICADVLSGNDARTPFNNANCRIVVGTGWTGTSIKTNTWVNTETGPTAIKPVSTGYPTLKGSWGAANDSVVQYRSEYAAGDLKTTGLDEAGIVNSGTSSTADLLAYAEVTPTINVTTDDTLQVDWEITFLGAT